MKRACTADYKIPGSDIVVKAGDEVKKNKWENKAFAYFIS